MVNVSLPFHSLVSYFNTVLFFSLHLFHKQLNRGEGILKRKLEYRILRDQPMNILAFASFPFLFFFPLPFFFSPLPPPLLPRLTLYLPSCPPFPHLYVSCCSSCIYRPMTMKKKKSFRNPEKQATKLGDHNRNRTHNNIFFGSLDYYNSQQRANA